jgi:putative DNA methylase
VRLIAELGIDAPQFEIVIGRDVAKAKPDDGTISRGVGRSPWTGQPFDGDYIKAETQAGRMGQILYAVAVKVTGGFEFRAPATEDLEAQRRAERETQAILQTWIVKGAVPTEYLSPVSNYDRGHRLYGMYRWADFFAPRQQLSLATVFA